MTVSKRKVKQECIFFEVTVSKRKVKQECIVEVTVNKRKVKKKECIVEVTVSKSKSKKGVYCRSNGTQKLLYCTRSGISQAAKKMQFI